MGSSAEEGEVIAIRSDEVGSALTEQEESDASAADPEMEQLRRQIKTGWPSNAKACPPEVRLFFKVRHELSVRVDNVVLRRSQQVFVPGLVSPAGNTWNWPTARETVSCA